MNDMPECFIIRTPKARKEHRCCECRGMILVGESYQRASGIWDGEPMRFKTCCDCAELRAKIDEGVPVEDRAYFEGLGEFCYEAGEPFKAQFLAIKEKRKKVLLVT